MLCSFLLSKAPIGAVFLSCWLRSGPCYVSLPVTSSAFDALSTLLLLPAPLRLVLYVSYRGLAFFASFSFHGSLPCSCRGFYSAFFPRFFEGLVGCPFSGSFFVWHVFVLFLVYCPCPACFPFSVARVTLRCLSPL